MRATDSLKRPGLSTVGLFAATGPADSENGTRSVSVCNNDVFPSTLAQGNLVAPLFRCTVH